MNPGVAAAQSEVTVVIDYRARPGNADACRRELTALVAIVVEREPDCHGIELLVDVDDPHRILLVERWSSRAAYFGPHLETPYLNDFRERAAGFVAGPPEIRCWASCDSFAPARPRPA
jgi:quinol monooxygenase YgiN